MYECSLCVYRDRRLPGIIKARGCTKGTTDDLLDMIESINKKEMCICWTHKKKEKVDKCGKCIHWMPTGTTAIAGCHCTTIGFCTKFNKSKKYHDECHNKDKEE